MMEFIKPKFAPIKVIFYVFLLTFVYSCHDDRAEFGLLECLLQSVETQSRDVDILVGQHNGWTDSTALIILTFHKKSRKIPIDCDLVGHYKGKDIFFYQTNIDSFDTKKYLQIPNKIIWKKFWKIKDDKDFPPMFYDPKSIQIKYNWKQKCFGEVIHGKGFLINDWQSKCTAVTDPAK